MRSPGGDMRAVDDHVRIVPHLGYVVRADAPATYLPKIPAVGQALPNASKSGDLMLDR